MPFDYGQGQGQANQQYQQQGQQIAQQAQADINSGDWSRMTQGAVNAAQQAAQLQKQHDRPNYGGYSGGANDAANYYKQLGEQYAGREGVTANQADARYDRAQGLGARDQSQDATSLLRDAAYGNAPSAAENQFNRSLSQSIQAQQAMANSARGGGANLAAAQQGGAMQAAQMQNAGAQQAAALRAQEMAQARSAYLGATQGQQQLDLSRQGLDTNTAFGQANLDMQQRQLNQQGQLALLGYGEQAQQAQLGADTSRYGADVGAQTAANQLQAQKDQSSLSAITGMAGAGLALLSDVSKKEKIAPAGEKMADDKEFKANPFLNAAGNALAGYGAGLSGNKFTPIQGINAQKQKEALDARARVGPDNAAQRNSYSPMYPSMQAPKPPLDQVMAQPGGPPQAAMPAGPGGAPNDMPLPPAMFQYMKGLNGGEIDPSKWKVTADQAPPMPPPPAYVGSPAYVPSDERIKMLVEPAGQEEWYGRGLLTGHADPNRSYDPHEVGFRKEQYPAGIMSDERAKAEAYRAGVDDARQLGMSGAMEETGRILDSKFAPPGLRALAVRNESIGQGIPEGRHKEMRAPRGFYEGTQVVRTGKTEPYEPSYSPPPAEPYVPPQLPRPPPPFQRVEESAHPLPRYGTYEDNSKGTEADHFLEHLHPYSYRYKNPQNEPATSPTGGRYLGVMAQDLEKTPYGDQLVKDTPRGKMLEHGAVTSAALAGLGRLHERVAQLEMERAGQAAGKREK